MKNTMMNLNLKQLIGAFKLIDEKEVTVEVAMVRGWLMDGIEALATEESFDEWLDTDNIDAIIAK